MWITIFLDILFPAKIRWPMVGDLSQARPVWVLFQGLLSLGEEIPGLLRRWNWVMRFRSCFVQVLCLVEKASVKDRSWPAINVGVGGGWERKKERRRRRRRRRKAFSFSWRLVLSLTLFFWLYEPINPCYLLSSWGLILSLARTNFHNQHQNGIFATLSKASSNCPGHL